MKKIYIVFMCSGEYDDYEEQPIRAFLDEVKANKFMEVERITSEKEKTIAAKEVKKIKMEDVNPVDVDELWNKYISLKSKADYSDHIVKEVDLDESI